MKLMQLIFLSLSVAVVTRTVVQEEIFRPLREWAKKKGRLAYPLTCQYCFSFWVTAGTYLISRFALEEFLPLVALANLWLILYEFQTVKIRLARENVVFAGEQVRAQQMANELGEINLKQTRELAARVAAHNANIEIEQTKSELSVGKRPN